MNTTSSPRAWQAANPDLACFVSMANLAVDRDLQMYDINQGRSVRQTMARRQPGKRHAIEQRRLERVLAADDHEGAPPRVRVDLDRQIVMIPAAPQ